MSDCCGSCKMFCESMDDFTIGTCSINNKEKNEYDIPCESYIPIFPQFNKATFRANREMLGISQNDFAEDTGMDVRTIKRWESPQESSQPPVYAWRLLFIMASVANVRYKSAMSAMRDIFEKQPEQVCCVLNLFRSQADFDAFCGVSNIEYTFVNALTKRIAQTLEDNGCSVIFEFIDNEPEGIGMLLLLGRMRFSASLGINTTKDSGSTGIAGAVLFPEKKDALVLRWEDIMQLSEQDLDTTWNMAPIFFHGEVKKQNQDTSL